MKKKNLIIIATLLVGTVTLSSWRLFGKDEPDNVTGGISPDGEQCTETGFQDSYFLGIRTRNDVQVTRILDCKTGEVIQDWH